MLARVDRTGVKTDGVCLIANRLDECRHGVAGLRAHLVQHHACIQARQGQLILEQDDELRHSGLVADAGLEQGESRLGPDQRNVVVQGLNERGRSLRRRRSNPGQANRRLLANVRVTIAQRHNPVAGGITVFEAFIAEITDQSIATLGRDQGNCQQGQRDGPSPLQQAFPHDAPPQGMPNLSEETRFLGSAKLKIGVRESAVP